MTPHLCNLARSRENLYFLNKEAEVIDHLRDVGRLEREREMISEAIGIANEATLRELQNLGFSRDTVLLLPVVPLVHVAWGDGKITDREACFIRSLAQIRGITRETPASALLETWLQKRPPEDF